MTNIINKIYLLTHALERLSTIIDEDKKHLLQEHQEIWHALQDSIMQEINLDAEEAATLESMEQLSVSSLLSVVTISLRKIIQHPDTECTHIIAAATGSHLNFVDKAYESLNMLARLDLLNPNSDGDPISCEDFTEENRIVLSDARQFTIQSLLACHAARSRLQGGPPYFEQPEHRFPVSLQDLRQIRRKATQIDANIDMLGNLESDTKFILCELVACQIIKISDIDLLYTRQSNEIYWQTVKKILLNPEVYEFICQKIKSEGAIILLEPKNLFPQLQDKKYDAVYNFSHRYPNILYLLTISPDLACELALNHTRTLSDEKLQPWLNQGIITFSHICQHGQGILNILPLLNEGAYLHFTIDELIEFQLQGYRDWQCFGIKGDGKGDFGVQGYHGWCSLEDDEKDLETGIAGYARHKFGIRGLKNLLCFKNESEDSIIKMLYSQGAITLDDILSSDLPSVIALLKTYSISFEDISSVSYSTICKVASIWADKEMRPIVLKYNLDFKQLLQHLDIGLQLNLGGWQLRKILKHCNVLMIELLQGERKTELFEIFNRIVVLAEKLRDVSHHSPALYDSMYGSVSASFAIARALLNFNSSNTLELITSDKILETLDATEIVVDLIVKFPIWNYVDKSLIEKERQKFLSLITNPEILAHTKDIAYRIEPFLHLFLPKKLGLYDLLNNESALLEKIQNQNGESHRMPNRPPESPGQSASSSLAQTSIARARFSLYGTPQVSESSSQSTQQAFNLDSVKTYQEARDFLIGVHAESADLFDVLLTRPFGEAGIIKLANILKTDIVWPFIQSDKLSAKYAVDVIQLFGEAFFNEVMIITNHDSVISLIEAEKISIKDIVVKMYVDGSESVIAMAEDITLQQQDSVCVKT